MVLGVPVVAPQVHSETVANVPSRALSRGDEAKVPTRQTATEPTGALVQNEQRGKVEDDRQPKRSREFHLPEAVDKTMFQEQPGLRSSGSGGNSYQGAYRNISSPSFSCAGRLKPVELTICADPDLARADGIMGALYHDLRAKLSVTDADALRDAQRAWIKHRDRLCPTIAADRYSSPAHKRTVACLQRVLDECITELQAVPQ